MVDVAQKLGDLFVSYQSMDSAELTARLGELHAAVTGRR